MESVIFLVNPVLVLAIIHVTNVLKMPLLRMVLVFVMKVHTWIPLQRDVNLVILTARLVSTVLLDVTAV